MRTRFIVSYLAVLLVVMALMQTVSFVSFRLIEGDIAHKNALLLEYVKKSFDTRLSEISKLSYEVGNNGWMLDISDSKGDFTTQQAVRLTRYLRILRCSGSVIEDICIYFPKTDKIITSIGRFTARHYYLLNQSFTRKSYQEFRSTINARHALEFYVEPVIALRGQKRTSEMMITFLHTFVLADAKGAAPLMIVQLDNTAIKAMIDAVAMDNTECFAIMDDEHRPIAFSGNEALLDRALPELGQVPKEGSKSVASGLLVASQTASLFSGIRYVSISSTGYFMGILDLVWKILVFGGLGILLIGLCIAAYFSQKNQKPLVQITHVIEREAGAAEPTGDVYAYIEQNIRRMLSENDTSIRRLEQQRQALRRALVSDLLRGEVASEERFQRRCAQYGIDSSDARHCAVILYVRDVPAHVEQSADARGDYVDAIFTLLVGAVRHMSGQPDPACDAELTQMDGLYVAWLMLPDRDDAATLREAYLGGLRRWITDECGLKIDLAVGNIYPGYNQLAQSYTEALKALDVLLARGGSSKVFEAIEARDLYGADKAIELLSRFVNCLKLGDYDNAGRLTGEVFAEYLAASLTPEIYLLHKATVQSVLLDALEQADALYGCQDRFAKERCALLAPQPGDLGETDVKALICALAGIKREHQSGSNEQRLQQLRGYIQAHFLEANLSVSMLADQFGMNNAYLSKVFKAGFGTGVLDYINKLRVERSKELLRDPSLSVQQVAERIGYLSDITFIRVFKRYEGTTPGRYREGGDIAD